MTDILQKLIANPSEHSQQSAVFCWAALPEVQKQYPQLKWMFAIPNGFYSTPGQKMKMKAEGLRSGVPDIFLPVLAYSYDKMHNYFGLFIEMKRVDKGMASYAQDEYISYLRSQGYKVEVCYGFDEARKVIISYLGGGI